jgi:predicted membrane metal-binding protein
MMKLPHGNAGISSSAQPHFNQTSLATYNDQQKSVSVEGMSSAMMRRLAAGIPKSVQDAFRTTGTSHIVAISGYIGTQTMFTGHTF